MRYLLLITTLFILLPINAQLKLGIKGGVGYANMISESQGEKYYNSSSKHGYHIGFALYSPLNDLDIFELETGFFLENKGFNIEHSRTIDEDSYSFFNPRPKFPKGEIAFNILYFTIPASVKVYINSFYFNTGFYISNALFAKSRIRKGELKDFYEEHDSETEREIKIGYNYNENEIIKPFDFGLLFGFGYSLKSTSISLNYDCGLLDVNSLEIEGSSLKNRVLKLSISYKI